MIAVKMVPPSNWSLMFRAVENSKDIAHAMLCASIHMDEIPSPMKHLIMAIHDTTQTASAALEAHRAEEDAKDMARYNKERRAKRKRKVK